MCQSVPSYRLLPRGVYQPMITSWGANKYHGLTTRTIWGLPSTQHYRGNHIWTKCQQDTWLTQKNIACGATAMRQTAYEILVRPTLEFATCAWAPRTKTSIQTARFVISWTSCVSVICTNVMWNSLPFIITTADARTRRQTQATNPTSNLHALPAVILRTLYFTVERTYRGSCHRIYHWSVPESRHPSHSVIDIIVDCFSVNHGLPVCFI